MELDFLRITASGAILVALFFYWIFKAPRR
jgi:hypothetical protein